MLLPDWTNEAARHWWMEKRRYLLEDVGIDGFKTEGGEHLVTSRRARSRRGYAR